MKTDTHNDEQDYFVFPEFYMYRNENGWRWGARNGGSSSPAAFEFLTACMKDACAHFNKRKTHDARAR